jgi:hypothetical protein
MREVENDPLITMNGNRRVERQLKMNLLPMGYIRLSNEVGRSKRHGAIAVSGNVIDDAPSRIGAGGEGGTPAPP